MSPAREMFDGLGHTCHALMCGRRVAPRFLMCRDHWAMVSNERKLDVYRAYRPGQCDDKRPSREYLAAARAAIDEVANKEGLGDYLNDGNDEALWRDR